MLKYLMIAVLFVTACQADADYWQDDEPEKLSSSVMLKIGATGSCSAVYIGDGNFITASHCIKYRTPLTIDGKAVEVMWRNATYDVAMVYLKTDKHRAAPLVCKDPEIGSVIHAITAPRGMPGIHSYGKVSGTKRQMLNWREVVPINLMAAHGSSGGPVYNSLMQIVGIVVGGFQPYGNFAIMVPGSTICKLLARE